MKPSNLFQQHKEVLRPYMCDTWGHRIGKYYTMMESAAEQGNDSDVVRFANDAWWVLPDSPAIHSPGFLELCDIAEGIFNEE